MLPVPRGAGLYGTRVAEPTPVEEALLEIDAMSEKTQPERKILKAMTRTAILETARLSEVVLADWKRS